MHDYSFAHACHFSSSSATSWLKKMTHFSWLKLFSPLCPLNWQETVTPNQVLDESFKLCLITYCHYKILPLYLFNSSLQLFQT